MQIYKIESVNTRKHYMGVDLKNGSNFIKANFLKKDLLWCFESHLYKNKALQTQDLPIQSKWRIIYSIQHTACISNAAKEF